MQQGKCFLTWPTYSDHVKGMMKELMMNEDFSDVTLVTEDKKQIKANISVLSACSPVFKDILKVHIDSVHEGIRYACDQCDYRATQKSSLNRHFKRMHDRVFLLDKFY